VSVIVPVLNEADRIGACLEGLGVQGAAVREVLIVDGGSRDATRDIVARAAQANPTIRLEDAEPIPADWNGKAWGMQVGLRRSRPATRWLLFLDADVRTGDFLAESLVSHARRKGLDVVSVATRQELNDCWQAILHPAMLATLIYRFGIPGHSTTNPHAAQGNGQCLLVSRQALERLGGLDGIRDSLCEDVTLVRLLASKGFSVGFYEADPDLVSVTMYASWREAWHGWSRSLPMRDGVTGRRFLMGLIELLLAQGLPGMLTVFLALRPATALARVNRLLLLMRLGILVGMRRAYANPPATYWLSPLVDLAVCIKLWQSAFRTEHRWRGRVMVRS
jgi:dolichol-phosphate mannosyltransferase